MQKVNFNPSQQVNLIPVVKNELSNDCDQVYNIEVTADHSYVANGFIVKNCRCRWVRINPILQWIDAKGDMRMRLEDESAWKRWHEKIILPMQEQMAKYNIMTNKG
jgi:hypothetical protein